MSAVLNRLAADDGGPPPAAADAPAPRWQPLTLEFTGSGSEYFRIWIVNLLLVVVTLTLYLPYARARRLRYFHGNTRVGGHALGFHGDPGRMLRGYLFMALFAAVYVGAGVVSPWSAAAAGLAMVLLWPALWQASLRFRLGNTSWRGMRLQFTGTTAGAYRALLPGLLPAVPLVVFYPLMAPDGDEQAPVLAWAGAAAGLSLLVLMAVGPWVSARMKRYQHGHYAVAGETTTFEATTGDFYRLSGGAGLRLLAMAAVMVLVVFLLQRGGTDPGPGGEPVRVVLMALVVVGFYAGVLALQPWMAARLQNLVWSRTRSPRLRIDSQLVPSRLVLLSARNALLTVLTLGLYRPFAVVAATRLRLHAVTLQTLGEPAGWLAGLQAGTGDAAGDAAADLLGVDVGL